MQNAQGPSDVVACGACATENPGGARFCMNCGASLEVGCPSCDTPLPPAAKFCFNCGHESQAGAIDAAGGQTARQVTSAIADDLRALTGGVGERRTITLMFCDVKDSTATAEGLDPEVWSDILRETMAQFVEPVERYGGTVARLLGDAILAYFGAPVAHEDDPQRAILAGLAIIERTRDLCARVRAEHDTDFDVRVGINTGLVVVGDLGTQRFSEYAALGDAANVAARMEQTATPGTVRVAYPTYKLVAPLFDVDPVGEIAVKGRDERVTAFTVMRAKGTPGQVRGIEGLTSPLVGRGEQLGRLVDAIEAVRAGSGRIVSLIGEAGLGKSRLVAELRAQPVSADVRWVAGQCYSYEDTTPYAPFLRALHDCLNVEASDAPAARSQAVFARVVDVLGADARASGAYLCAMLGLPVEGDDRQLIDFADPATMRERVFDAVAALFEGLSHAGPLVVELEDLHWADPTSIELLTHLLPLADRAAVAFLLLFRPRRDEPSWTVHEAAGRDHAHRYTAVELSPLDDAGSRELVANLLRVEGLSDHVRETILDKTDGNPFFVEEVIRSLLDDGTIRRDDERFVATGRLDDLRVPDSLAAVLTTRLDRLSPASRAVVQAASVIGREFSRDMLGSLTGRSTDLDEALTDLQKRELVFEQRRDPEVAFSFKHVLTRDAACDTLLHSVRRDLHRRVGDLIEERDPERVFELALHFAEADEPVRAVPYLVRAGDAAFGAFAREDAARYFQRALDLWGELQDIDLARRAFVGLGDAQLYLGDPAASIATFERMLEFARTHDDAETEIAALNKGGVVTLLATGDVDVAEGKLLAARALAEEGGDRKGLAEFHVGFCYLNVSQGRLDKAEEALGEMAEVCMTLDTHSRNFGLTHYAAALVYQARFDDARAAIARAKEHAELDGDVAHLAELLGLEALVAFSTGHPEPALELAQRGMSQADEVGAAGPVPLLGWVGAASAAQLCAFETVRRFADASSAAGQATGNTGPGAAAMMVLAAVEHAVHGASAPEVQERVDAALALYAAPMSRATATSVLAGNAARLIVDGELERAETDLRAAEVTASATSRLVEPELAFCRAAIAVQRGEPVAAAALLDETDRTIGERGLELFRPRAMALRGVLRALDGDPTAATALFTRAEDDAGRRGMRLDTLWIQRTAGDALADAGAADAAAGFRARLGETVADIGARLDDPDQRRAFLRTNAIGVAS